MNKVLEFKNNKDVPKELSDLTFMLYFLNSLAIIPIFSQSLNIIMCPPFFINHLTKNKNRT